MSKKISIYILVVALVVIGALVYKSNRCEWKIFAYRCVKDTESLVSPTPFLTPLPSPVTSPEALLKSIITYYDSGYSPSAVNVKRGDIVVFTNGSSKMMWTASAMHPSHMGYPGTDITKCGTPSQQGMFDACKGYGKGESWEFKFNEIGTWKYHNHLQPNHTGTIMIE